MALSATWMGGYNHSGANWSAVQYGDYILSSSPGGSSTGYVGIWNRLTDEYRKFSLNLGDGMYAMVVHDGDPMLLISGTPSSLGGGVRIDPTTTTITEEWSTGFRFYERRGRPLFVEDGDGRLWNPAPSSQWGGYLYGDPSPVETVMLGATSYGWFVDGLNVYHWNPGVGSSGEVRVTNLGTGSTSVVGTGMFPPGISPNAPDGHFVIIGGVYYWIRNDGVIVWDPGGGDAYLIPSAGSYGTSGDLRVGVGVSAWMLSGSYVITYNLLAATKTTELIPGIPVGRSTSGREYIIDVDGEFWVPTTGITP